jgi:hypothetical protein
VADRWLQQHRWWSRFAGSRLRRLFVGKELVHANNFVGG